MKRLPATRTPSSSPRPSGAPTALTDPTGALVTEYSYSPFGTTSATGAPSPNPFQYTGRENDGAGLYYYRARYYEPGRGRLVQEDPIRLLDESNIYTYADNRPVANVDPLGLYSWNEFMEDCGK